MVQRWHRRTYEGILLPVGSYAGEVRDSDPRFPELISYEVRVGSDLGVASRDVPTSLAQFEAAFAAACGRLDANVVVGTTPTSPELLAAVLHAAAAAHGELVRIHPFANGNGRSARLLANWVTLRYGLPAFVRLQPRPTGAAYAEAARQSMRGRHTDMTRVFNSMLQSFLARGSTAM